MAEEQREEEEDANPFHVNLAGVCKFILQFVIFWNSNIPTLPYIYLNNKYY